MTVAGGIGVCGAIGAIVGDPLRSQRGQTETAGTMNVSQANSADAFRAHRGGADTPGENFRLFFLIKVVCTEKRRTSAGPDRRRLSTE